MPRLKAYNAGKYGEHTRVPVGKREAQATEARYRQAPRTRRELLKARRPVKKYRAERMRGGSYRVVDTEGRVYGVYVDKAQADEHVKHLRAAERR